jgi:hypothetical protein
MVIGKFLPAFAHVGHVAISTRNTSAVRVFPIYKAHNQGCCAFNIGALLNACVQSVNSNGCRNIRSMSSAVIPSSHGNVRY